MNQRLLKKAVMAAAALVVVSSGAAPRQEVPTDLRNKVTAVVNRQNASLTSAPHSNFSQKKKSASRADNANEEVILEESFNLWTEGSQEDPEWIGALEGYYIDDTFWNINPAKMQDNKMWVGYATCAAGGTCGLCYPGMGGMIQTPMGDYSGELHITMKAKMLDNEFTEDEEDGLLIGAVCCAPWDNPQPVPSSDESSYYAMYEFIPNDGEWHEVDWTFLNSYGEDDCFLQFNTYSQLLIDDIKITVNPNFLADPRPLPATNYTLDGFTANWTPVKNASEYLLSCWRNVETSDKFGQMTCDFNDVNSKDGVIDLSDPNFPKGWDFDFNGATPRVVSTGDGFDSNALVLDADNIYISSPSTGAPILDATVRIQYFGEEDEDEIYPGVLGFSGWDGYKWVGLSSLYLDDYFLDEMIEYDEIAYAIEYNGGKYYKLRIDTHDFYNGAYVVIDDIKITTLPPCEKESVVTSLPVKGTSYVFTGLNPESDYYYDVSAVSEELGIDSGEPIACAYAFGLPAPTPLAATDIYYENGSYTANWEKSPKADQYIVNTFLGFTAPEDIDNHVMLSESFKKSDLGFSVEDPLVLNNFDFVSLDDFCDNTGWVGYLAAIADKAVGGVGMPYYGFGGEIQTPWLSLANNDGKFHVQVSACTTPYYDDELCVVDKNGELFSSPLSDEYQTFDMDFTTGTNFDFLAFYTKYKSDFFINFVEVTQNLKKGDKVAYQQDAFNTPETTYRVESFQKPGENYSYAYSVTGIHSDYFSSAYSDFSPLTFVEVNPSGVDSVSFTENINAKGGKGEIMVVAPMDAHVSVSAPNGMTIAEFNGGRKLTVPAGIYIVKAANKTFKLLVK